MIWTVTVAVCEKECVVPAASKANSLAQSQGSSMEVGRNIEDHLCGANFDDTPPIRGDSRTNNRASLAKIRPKASLHRTIN